MCWSLKTSRTRPLSLCRCSRRRWSAVTMPGLRAWGWGASQQCKPRHGMSGASLYQASKQSSNQSSASTRPKPRRATQRFPPAPQTRSLTRGVLAPVLQGREAIVDLLIHCSGRVRKEHGDDPAHPGSSSSDSGASAATAAALTVPCAPVVVGKGVRVSIHRNVAPQACIASCCPRAPPPAAHRPPTKPLGRPGFSTPADPNNTRRQGPNAWTRRLDRHVRARGPVNARSAPPRSYSGPARLGVGRWTGGRTIEPTIIHHSNNPPDFFEASDGASNQGSRRLLTAPGRPTHANQGGPRALLRAPRPALGHSASV